MGDATSKKKKAHNCSDCTHTLCELCSGTGSVAKVIMGGSGSNKWAGVSQSPCPNGCPRLQIMNGST